jgi:hypothetical protein
MGLFTDQQPQMAELKGELQLQLAPGDHELEGWCHL